MLVSYSLILNVFLCRHGIYGMVVCVSCIAVKLLNFVKVFMINFVIIELFKVKSSISKLLIKRTLAAIVCHLSVLPLNLSLNIWSHATQSLLICPWRLFKNNIRVAIPENMPTCLLRLFMVDIYFLLNLELISE